MHLRWLLLSPPACASIPAYWLPITSREDAQEIADCAHRYCHVAGLNTVVLNLVLLYALVLVLLASLVTGLIRKAHQQARSKQEAAPHDEQLEP
jgi:disulfide bond formation protein DsbB